MKHTLFVYGTLKRGYRNHRRLLDATFLGEGTSAQPVYAMSNVGFPYLWEVGEGGAQVSGELFEIDDAMLERCDALEGHPDHYCREQRTFNVVPKSEGQVARPVCAWVYLIQNDRRTRGEPVKPVDGVLTWTSPYKDPDFDLP